MTRRYGYADMGTLPWARYETSNIPVFYARITDMKAGNAQLACAKYLPQWWTSLSTREEDTIQPHPTLNIVYVADSSYTDAETFAAAMSGVYLVYELAESTTETADPYTTPQIVNDFGTEEFVDAGVTADPPTRDVAIPVGHNSRYQPNLKAKLEMAPNSPEGDGDYIVRQVSGINTYVPITFPADELPAAPTTDGTYVLKVTVADGTATYSWVSAT